MKIIIGTSFVSLLFVAVATMNIVGYRKGTVSMRDAVWAVSLCAIALAVMVAVSVL